VACEFQGQGVWRFTIGVGWQQLTPADASQVVVDNYGDVACEFPGQGVFRFNDFLGGTSGSWEHLNVADASQVAIDGFGDVAAAFSNGAWLDKVGGQWQQLTGANASLIVGDK
jgi:hypothetical protein